MKINFKNCLEQNKGFTLVEMLVVVGIFALLSGIIFSDYNGFATKASLSNLAHQIALTVREAQVYGISVVQQGAGAYGAYFSSVPGGSNNHRSFIFFKDANSNEIFDSDSEPGNPKMQSTCSGGDECLGKTNITTGDFIETIMSGGRTEGSLYDDELLDDVHIVFTRPNPDASLYGKLAGSNDLVGPLSDVEITLKSPRGESKTVVIWSTGQITVE